MRVKLFKMMAVLALLTFTILLYRDYAQLNLFEPRFRLESIGYLGHAPDPAYFESQIIPQPAYLPAAHSSSFTMLPNNDLLAFWFAGTKEGQPDVKIWHSWYHAGKWLMATSLVDPQMIAKANHRYVIKVGNPVIYRAADGLLHLFVVSVSVGGWAGSALNHLTSADEGKTWSAPQRIIISPFFNISTLVRASAVSLSDGGFYLPVYHEFIRKYPELLRFNSAGKFVEQIRISAKNQMLQPSLVPISTTQAWAYLRNGSSNAESRPMFVAATFSGGKTWQTPVATNLTNPDSSVVVVNLGDGRLLMVYNPLKRSQLTLAISHDGLNWRPIYNLEDSLGKEFSYPAIQINGNNLDILYTNNRQNIKHVRFNRRWLNEVINHAKY